MAESEGVASALAKVIGVGGGGGNAINTMVANRLQGVQFIVANADRQALDQSKADVCLQIGRSMTKGLGAGAHPETGAQSAHERIEDVKEVLKGSSMAFVVASQGGGTGTGTAPAVAKTSKELGALAIAMVTKPFRFEGKHRLKNAEVDRKALHQHADAMITVPNDRLLGLPDAENFKTLRHAGTDRHRAAGGGEGHDRSDNCCWIDKCRFCRSLHRHERGRSGNYGLRICCR